MTEWLLPTGLVKPLTLNTREHWAARARWTKLVRQTTRDAALVTKIGPHRHVHARIEYTPRVNRRIDATNLAATLKPALDGLVDAHVIPDDTATYVTEHQAVINPAQPAFTACRLWLRVWV